MSSYPLRARRFSILRAFIIVAAVAVMAGAAVLALSVSAQQGRSPVPSDTGRVPVAEGATRGFVATWHLDEATPLGAEVRVRVSMRISNYSGYDYTSATLILRDPLDPGGKLAAIGVFRTAREDSLSVAADVTVPAREYRRWQKGAAPQFVLEFKDSAGKPRAFPIELVRMPVKEAR